MLQGGKYLPIRTGSLVGRRQVSALGHDTSLRDAILTLVKPTNQLLHLLQSSDHYNVVSTAAG